MGKTKIWLGIVAGAVFLAACGDGPINGEFVPNSPPDTDVSATPPVLSAAGFEVSFNWTGADPDGEIIGFEWRISNNGEDGIVDVVDTLETFLPWQFTTVTDSTFLVDADLDSFPPDVTDPRQGASNYRYWQTHTFYIRAIDEKGYRDPSPAHVSFTATTLAPTVQITLPKAIRDHLHVSTGDRIDFLVDDDGEVVVRSVRSRLDELRGMLHRKGRKAVTVEEMDAAIARVHGER